MSAERDLPSPWAQECPRSVRLSPGDLLVPAGALRALLFRGAGLTLRYSGFGLEPVIRDGDVITEGVLRTAFHFAWLKIRHARGENGSRLRDDYPDLR
jgi:hypothetical protein